MLASGCVWSPSSRTEHESSGAVVMQGFAGSASTTISIHARNYDTGAFDVVGTTVSNSGPMVTGPDMFTWNTLVTLAPRYWAPGQAGCSAGRAELRAIQAGNQLGTFTEPARECAVDMMEDGEHPFASGDACSDGREVILFDNNGVCAGAETAGMSPVGPPTVLTFEGRSIVYEVFSYPVQGKTIYGMVCRPNDGLRHPVQIFNHGGWNGVGYLDEETGCRRAASKGWVLAMSAYRGEPLYLPSTGQKWTSTGSIELCNGEVTDVMRMTELVLARPYADPDRVLMHGVSHGGCITTRAVERGAPVQAAIDFAGPSDWVSLYNTLGWWIVPAVPSGPTAPFPTWMAAWIGGTPAALARAYEWRSSRFFAADLAARTDVKYLHMHGTDDTIVGYDHACKLAKAAYGAAGSQNWHVDTSGSATPASPPNCTGVDTSLTWLTGARPSSSWPGNRYILMYDGLQHGFTGPTGAAALNDYLAFINALGWGVPY